MMGIKKVVAGSRNRKREKKMNATTNAKTRNVYVREIMMPVVFCKDCIWWHECKTKDKFPFKKDSCNKFGIKMDADDFCSRGVRE